MVSNDKLCYISQRVIRALNDLVLQHKRSGMSAWTLKIVMRKGTKWRKILGKNADEVDVLA